jgi:hypothetical protein
VARYEKIGSRRSQYHRSLRPKLAREREFRRGIELNPNSADGHFIYADFLIWMKRAKEWQVEIQRVLELDPFNAFFRCFYGWHLVYLHRCDEFLMVCRLLFHNPIVSELPV